MDLRWSDLAPLTAGCHLSRTVYRPGGRIAMHGHGFGEIWWVEHGTITQDTPFGSRRCEAGEAFLVRPGHHHALHGAGTIVNLAISDATLAELESRYGDSAGWPWRSGGEPASAHLDAADLAELARRVDALHAGPGDRLAREAFLVDLLARLRPRGTGLWRGAPSWLAAALERLAEPPTLAQGLPALARLTGRSREHLSRTIGQCCGRRAIDVLTELRMRWAERRLAVADDAISDIARECGFSGRARFNQLFRERTGQTPVAYRRSCRGAVMG